MLQDWEGLRLGDEGTVDFELSVVQGEGGVLDHDVDADARRGEEIVVRSYGESDISRLASHVAQRKRGGRRRGRGSRPPRREGSRGAGLGRRSQLMLVLYLVL